MQNIGNKVKYYRTEKNLSTNQLEALSGVKQSTISRIESNQQSPSVDTLLKISAALDISIVELFEEKEILPYDLLSLLNTAKKLSPNQRKKLTDMLNSFLD